MKIDYEYIKEYLNQFNYTLISDSYERSNKKLDMICNKGHECSISWDNFMVDVVRLVLHYLRQINLNLIIVK